MIDHFEPPVSLGEINTADIHHSLKLALGMIPQECQDGDNSRRCNVERQFILQHGELLDEFRQALHEV